MSLQIKLSIDCGCNFSIAFFDLAQKLLFCKFGAWYIEFIIFIINLDMRLRLVDNLNFHLHIYEHRHF